MPENVSRFQPLENPNNLSVQAIFRPSSPRFYPPFSAKSQIYNDRGELVEIHQKYPIDTGHRKVKEGEPT